MQFLGAPRVAPSQTRLESTYKSGKVVQTTGATSDRGQRKYFTEHPDIAFFQRGRICLSCDHEFVTTEIEIEFLLELMQLRRALGDIKTNAERYTKEASAAGKSLAALTKSLGVLKTLKIYQETDG